LEGQLNVTPSLLLFEPETITKIPKH
jgi:hypothetical protein